jgi:cellulose synthase/poly-beta-1,6-N-acetylglucosamine synthase-like glycosyltransferase
MPFTTYLPKVSIIIPAHNEQLNIDRCITSLKAQTYPHHLIEVIVVNDGSTDHTGAVVEGHINGTAHWNGHIRLHNRVIPALEFGGVLMLMQGGRKGKPGAVNQGIANVRGDIIMTVDSDVVLEPEAVEQAVAAFVRDPELDAATAHLIVDHNLLVIADDQGHVALDEHSLPLPLPLSTTQRFLASAQFIEYLQAFRIGRHSEAIRNELFTLSGACCIFRREAMQDVGGYHARTVSEDTDITFAFQRRGHKVSYLPQVRVHLAPIVEWKALYAQRVRWQRGELEVMAVHTDLLGKATPFWRWAMPRRLQNDHTLAILRLVWLLMLPMLPILGYSPALIAQAMVLMYGMYLLSDALQLLTAYTICGTDERRLLRTGWTILPWMQFYRLATYLFRLSGMLKTLTEKPRWTTSAGWLDKLRLPGSARLKALARELVRVWAE